MKMIAVNSANLPGISGTPWDGILGLLPTTSSGSDLFVKVMKDQGIIDKAVFSVYYEDTVQGSEITFGGYDEARVPFFENFTFTDLYDHNYWSVGLTSMKYGAIEIGGEAERGLIDTGSSLLLLPTNDFTRWYDAISEGKTCGDYGGYKGCYCPGEDISIFEPIYVRFDNWEYKISPEEYVVSIPNQGNEFCYFLVSKNGHFGIPTAVLGDTFIRNYYMYHDMENLRIGLYGDHMVYYESEKNHMFLIGIIIVAVLVIVVGIGLFVCTRYVGGKEDDDRSRGLIGGAEAVELKERDRSSD